MGKLDGKVALITGSTSGIGLETARLFAAEGARVVVHGRDLERLQSIAAELGGDILAIPGIVESLDDIDRMMASIRDRFGRIDVLFANAGMFRAASVEEISEALIDELFSVNFKGAFFTFQRALPLLSEGASVIFNTSAMMHIGVHSAGVYSATKAALRSLVRTIALEMGPRLRVNVLSPGTIATPLHQHSAPPPEMVERITSDIMARTPLKRVGVAADVAKAALFLASDDSSYIQGEEIVVADGWSAV